MIVRLHYAGGATEDIPLYNGEQFADYIRRVDVPGSKFAFNLSGRQIRYFAVTPQKRRPDRNDRIRQRPRRDGPNRHGGDGGDGGVTIYSCW